MGLFTTNEHHDKPLSEPGIERLVVEPDATRVNELFAAMSTLRAQAYGYPAVPEESKDNYTRQQELDYSAAFVNAQNSTNNSTPDQPATPSVTISPTGALSYEEALQQVERVHVLSAKSDVEAKPISSNPPTAFSGHASEFI